MSAGSPDTHPQARVPLLSGRAARAGCRAAGGGDPRPASWGLPAAWRGEGNVYKGLPSDRAAALGKAEPGMETAGAQVVKVLRTCVYIDIKSICQSCKTLCSHIKMTAVIAGGKEFLCAFLVKFRGCSGCCKCWVRFPVNSPLARSTTNRLFQKRGPRLLSKEYLCIHCSVCSHPPRGGLNCHGLSCFFCDFPVKHSSPECVISLNKLHFYGVLL